MNEMNDANNEDNMTGAKIAKLSRAFDIRPAKQWMAEAANRPNPKSLWLSLWYENEVACLFADTNMGKSIYAVQIAEHVSQEQKVLYFDFEMTDKQFQLRYTDAETGDMHDFNDNLLRVELSPVYVDLSNIHSIISHISDAVDISGARVIIIDNITWICNRAESGDAAGELMQMLIDLKRRKGLSILVLAHTPKRNTASKLTQNSLAGSKRIANFMDSMFAIGATQTDRPAGRYIKQIKVRSSEMEYGEDHVITAWLVKEGDYVSLMHIGYGRECDLLAPVDSNEANLKERVSALSEEGLSVRKIAEQLGVSKSLVFKVMKAG
ncbi:MAG: AAA family ATPase [Muribaculaceae bacterium]